MINEESERKSLEVSMQYEFDKKEIATKSSTRKKVNAINLEEKQKQEVIILLVMGFVLKILLFYIIGLKVTQNKRIIEDKKFWLIMPILRF